MAVSKPAEQHFQPLDFRIGFAGPVPQVPVSCCQKLVSASVVPGIHTYQLSCPCLLLFGLRFSFARSCCMPRWRLTRTEPCVRPVRDAISGPVMPSTSRIINVSL